MCAAHYQLDHLIAILDSNMLQLDGPVQQIMDTGNLQKKFESFGFFVQTIDGHRVEEIGEALDRASLHRGSPSMIIAHTTKGKGVSFMENQVQWHGRLPDEEQFQQAFRELYEKEQGLEGEG